jgi:hypothetical protein
MQSIAPASALDFWGACWTSKTSIYWAICGTHYSLIFRNAGLARISSME